jgi:carboxyl-terminal processing protease
MEFYHRMEDGELESADSVKLVDSLKFTTPGGKTVYGGGGIMPDVFIPVERNAGLKFFNESVNKGILYQFAFDYTDRNRAALKVHKDVNRFDKSFSVTESLYSEYIAFAEKNGIKYPPAETASSKQRISELMKSYIARNLFDSEGFYPIYLRTDPAFLKAIEVLGKR